VDICCRMGSRGCRNDELPSLSVLASSSCEKDAPAPNLILSICLSQLVSQPIRLCGHLLQALFDVLLGRRRVLNGICVKMTCCLFVRVIFATTDSARQPDLKHMCFLFLEGVLGVLGPHRHGCELKNHWNCNKNHSPSRG
jgi:hypothetical protein